MLEKIQKILAQSGFGSRRQIEKMIEAGQIKVNGKIAKLGDRATYHDQFQIDGLKARIQKPEAFKTRVLIYYKPDGEICTRHDPEGRPTVFSRLPDKRTRWINVGRLDINSSGLLLFTNDGELAKRLMHPSYEIEREYSVRVLGEVKPEMLAQLKKGVELEDGFAAFDKITAGGGDGANQWYHVIIKEGRTREVRRLWQSQGLTVSRLIRIRYGDITLPRYLRRGEFQELPAKEIDNLKRSVRFSSLNNHED